MRTISGRFSLSVLSAALLVGTMSAAPPARARQEVGSYKYSLSEPKGRRHVSKQKRKAQDNTIAATPTKKAIRLTQQSVKRNTSADVPIMYGVVDYSDSRYNIDHTLCRIPTSDKESFEVIVEDVNAIDGGTYIDGIYYAAYHSEYYGEYQLYINSFNVASGSKMGTVYGEPYAEATDVAYNPADGKVYGCFVDPDSPDYSDYYFGTINYQTGQTTKISDLPRQIAAIAIDAKGKIYIIDKQQEKVGYSLTTVAADLYEISATTGEMTLIGKTGQAPEYRSSACIDPATGRMFWVVNPDDDCGYLYEVDKSTGSVSLIYQFPDNETIVGMYIPASKVTTDSPAGVTDLVANFHSGDLQGYVSFTMPTEDVSGNILSGSLDYSVMNGATVVAQGAAEPGEHVSTSVSVPEEGLYKFTVTVSNESGPSPENTISIYVGHDTPMAPGSSSAIIDGNTIKVSWEPVATTVNGGTIDPSQVAYTVKRYPGAVVLPIASGATTISDPIDDVETLSWRSYTIEAKYDGVMSSPATTDKVIIGYVIPPYYDDYNKIDTFDYYTVHDVNGDNTTWGPYIGNLRVVYSDDATLAMDDWLISPPIKLQGGKSYRFSIDVITGNSKAKEDFEIMWGTGNTVADMVNTVVERQSVAHTEYVTYRGFVTPTSDGLHYIGVHGCSAPDMYTITIDNFNLEDGIDASLPDVCTDFVVAPRTNGELKTDISVKAPEKQLNGSAITSLKSVVIKRNGHAVKTFESPAPGATLNYVDEYDECADVDYSVYATNDAGNGPSIEVTTFVGVLAPANPENVNMVETSTLGEVTVSWDSVDKDINGNNLDPQYVTYGIYEYTNGELEPLYENLKTTSHTFVATTDTDKQKFAQYFVAAQTLGGFSEGISTPSVPLGVAYEAPYTESFSMGTLSYILGSSAIGGASWGIQDSSIGIPAADADNGFIASKATSLLQYATLYTGKIDISNLKTPILSFYVYDIEDGETLNEDEVDVEVVCDGIVTLERNVKIAQLQDGEGWCRVIVPLDKYAGKNIQLRITSHHNTWGNIFIDRINVISNLEHNLTARTLTVPAEVQAGTKFNLVAKISNTGQEEVSDYIVDLICDDEVVGSKKGEAISSDTDKNIQFSSSISAIDENEHTYSFRIIYADDQDFTDNASESVRVAPFMSTLPFVKDLSAVKSEDGILLTWSDPDMAEYIPDMVTDDFESYDRWTNEGIGDWTFIDRDGAGIGGFNDGTVFPGIATGSKQSFWVFDSEAPGFNGDIYFMSNSGTGHLAQMFSYTTDGEATCDDWAISPELCGIEQTISFAARCYYSQYPETFQVLYSTGSVNPDDFVLVDSKTISHDDWADYSFTLPEGAKRAAIRCISYGGFMLFIDDFRFIPVGDPSELDLLSFNLYRDGEFVETVEASSRQYADTNVDADADPEYLLTAVFDKGESRPSNKAKPSLGSVITAAADAISISGGVACIEVRGAAGEHVEVYGVDGTDAASVISREPMLRIPASAGIYVVKAGNKTAKVIVR